MHTIMQSDDSNNLSENIRKTHEALEIIETVKVVNVRKFST